MAKIAAPFNVGDKVKFGSSGSGYPKGTVSTVTAIGYDESDNRPGKDSWRIKIDIDHGRRWRSAGWFVKVK